MFAQDVPYGMKAYFLWKRRLVNDLLMSAKRKLERFSLDCRIGIGFGFGFGFTTSFGWLVYLLWFWFYDSQVKTALTSIV